MNYLHSQSEASHENTFFSSCLNRGEDQDKKTKMLPTPFLRFQYSEQCLAKISF